MSNRPFDSDQTALEIFATRRLEARKRIYGAPIDWKKADAAEIARRLLVQPWQEIDGVSFAVGSDIVAHRAHSLGAADQSSLADAIRDTWPDSNPAYQKMIQRRYLEAFLVPPAEAVMAVSRGYSSPAAAMKAGVIKKRRYVGFSEEREP